MGTASIHEGVRRMRFADLLDRQERGDLTQDDAAEMLGVSVRTFQRWRDRYVTEGDTGLADRRLGRPSPKRAPREELERMLGLFRDKYADFTVKHFHEQLRKRFMEGFHYDAHPMGMFVSTLGALSTLYPEAKGVEDGENRMKQIVRLVAKAPTIAACCYRFSQGLPFVYPDNGLDFPTNFLNMMWRIGNDYEVDPMLARTLF